MYRDCDHLIDDLYIYTVRGNWRYTEKMLLVKPVYYRETVHHEYKKIVDLKGEVGENLAWVEPSKMKHICCKGISLEDYTRDELWDKMVRTFIEFGINPSDIGLFGSKKLNFKTCKDLDFIIYGKDNMYMLQHRMEEFKKKLGLYNHTIAHAVYQAEVHGKYFDKSKNDLLFCLLNKWSTCAFTEKLTSTIRFVDETDNSGQLLKQLLYNNSMDNTITIKGVVSKGELTSFMPRRFNITTTEKAYEVIVPLWIYHQCVRNNDLVSVTGTLVQDKIVVRRYDHGIKFL